MRKEQDKRFSIHCWICAFAALAFFVADAFSATTYSWKADSSGNYSGSFADSDHWSPSIDNGPGSGYPESTDNFNHVAQFPRVDADYTVTLPEGVVTNLSTLLMYAQYGRKVTIDGSRTTWVIPTADGNTYGKFEIHSGGLTAAGQPKAGPICFKRYGGDGAATGLGTFRNFTLSLASAYGGIPGTDLTLTGDCDWPDNSVRLFVEGVDADNRMHFSFKDGRSPNFPPLQLGFSSATNLLTFSNYKARWMNGLSYAPATVALANDAAGVSEMNVTDGSMLTNDLSNVNLGSAIALGYNGNSRLSSAKTFRINVNKGSLLNICRMTASLPGHHEVNVDGVGSRLSLSNTSQVNTFGKGASSTATVSVVNGAYMYVYCTTELGDPSSEGMGSLVVSNASVQFDMGVKLNRGRITLLDGANVRLSSSQGTQYFEGGGVEGADAELYADGATVHFVKDRSRTLIRNFTAAKLGPKGLALSVEGNYDFTVPQNFTDWSYGGTLTAMGRSGYPLVLSSTDSRQSNLVVAQETVKLAAGANHYSHVVVTNGATFSLVGGQTAPTLRALTLGSAESRGVIALDLGTVVTVDGPISLVNPGISFSSALANGTNTVFRQTVEPDEDSVVKWEVFVRGAIVQGLPANKFSHLQVVRSGGDWLYQIVITDSLPSSEGTVGWTGPGTSWNDSANWDGGAMPDAAHEAVFGGSGAQAVTVSGTVDASGVSFGNDEGVVVSGGRIRISENMDAEIAASSGDSEISSAVQMSSRVAVPVAEGATLRVSGEVTGGGFAKSGAGRLVVENAANKMPDGFGLNGGWLEFTTLGAFGYVFDTTLSDLVSGTLEYTGASGATRAVTAVSGPVVIKPESELTMPLPSATAGAIIKRGAGRLVFDVSGDATLALAPSSGHTYYSAGDEVAYPADGSAPETYNAVTVAEGELVVRGTGSSVPKVTIGSGSKQAIAVGIPVAAKSGETAHEPRLVVDHATLEASCLYAASGFKAETAFARNAYIVVTNGGVLSATINANNGNSELGDVHVYADDGLVAGPHSLNARDTLTSTNRYEFVNGGRLLGLRMTFAGSTVLSFDHSVLAQAYDAADRTKWKTAELVNYGVKPSAITDWSFSNGSIFACHALEYSAPKLSRENPHTLRFENSEWWGGAGDKAFATASLNITTVVSGTGLIQQPAAGQTYTWITPVTGEGGFVKRGAGTVVFAPQQKYHAAESDPVTLGYYGVTDIQEGLFKVEQTAFLDFVGRTFRVAGTLDMSGGSLTAPRFVAAGGTVSNAVCTALTIAVDPENLDLITLDYANGLTISRRVAVDFGVETGAPYEKGTVMTVARWTGAQKPDVSRWRAENVGDGCSCSFVANNDGTVSATVVNKRGLMLIVH